jgi:hypothetical protein
MHENLEGVNLKGASLTGADLIDADLKGADLIDADLKGADLRGANLAGANLTGADLTDADLTVANLAGADLPLRFITLPRVGHAARTCWAWVMDDGVKITLGCRRFASWDEARAHYTAPDYEGECADRIDAALARLDYGQAMETVVRAMEITSS